MATDYLTQVTDELSKRGISADVAAQVLNAANGAKNSPVTLPANPADAITDKSVSSSTTNDAAPAAGDWYTKTRQQLGLDTADAQAAIAGEDRTEFIKDYYGKILEAELAGMDTAYKNADTELDLAKNRVAAQDAVARQAFDERAAATGLNTGTSGQAELARSSVLQGNLAQIDRDKSSLLAEYESAIAKAKAENDVAMTEALYEELMRLKGIAGKSSASSSTSGGSYGGSYGGSSGGSSASAGANTSGEVKANGTIVRVQADGKAPAGCKVGDLIVTGGGTYIITKVNADGSYESEMYEKGVTTGNYTGKYSDGSVGAGATQTAPVTPETPTTPATPTTPPTEPQNPTAITGNYYNVQPDGKAPAGLSVGDKVVTGGGVFTITKVNADGSYASEKSTNNGALYNQIDESVERMKSDGFTNAEIIEKLENTSDRSLTADGMMYIAKKYGLI